MKFSRVVTGAAVSLGVLVFAATSILPAYLERRMNLVTAHESYTISPEAKRLHQTLAIADLHSDSTLWNRDLLQRADRGHVDIPRMREGNAALQMFTTVTRTPRGQNLHRNSAEALDNISLLAVAQRWPVATWSSLTARALYQGEKLRSLAEISPRDFQMVYTAADLKRLMQRREKGEPVVGGLLGTEGSHALDGKLDNVDLLFDAGFRMMSLQHFFDNKLGGSLHGESGEGLTLFGEQAVDRMLKLGVMVDVSHSSPAVVQDVLDRSTSPVIVSHTGFYGHCQSPRNISDQLMVAIAEAGGLIAVGYWDNAVCHSSVQAIVAAIRYGIDLVGVDHVALGSDFDGSVEAPLDISELSALTEEMLSVGFSETEIRKVMGLNALRFFTENLPSG